ncbi:protein FAM204A [Synchiropus picturatus]
MYSGLLPRGLNECDLSSDDEEEEKEGEESSVVIRDSKQHIDADADSKAPTCSLPGVSQEHWQKFCELRKKKDEANKAVTSVPRRRKRRRHNKGDGNTDSLTGPEKEESAETRQHQDEQQKHWDGLKQYFGVNDRFHPPVCSNPPPKSGLERSIERAIAEGDIAKAEEMSDRLATRELAVKIAEAADCRDFVKHKQTEEALRNTKKRKKQIAWGFEAKQRWETKSNMGFM